MSCNKTNTLSAKRGDDFKRNCFHRDSAGNAIDLTDYAIRSQVRTVDGTLLGELTITKQNQVTDKGYFHLGAPALMTKAWPIGTHHCDIQYTYQGITQSTKTFFFEVIKDVTHD